MRGPRSGTDNDGRPERDLVARDEVARATRAALRQAAQQGASPVPEGEDDGREAIVRLAGRPVLEYKNGRVQAPTILRAENERWRVLVALARKKIDAVSASVGQLALLAPDGGTECLGTAWRIGADLVVTNRHVVCPFLEDDARRPGEKSLCESFHMAVDFSVTLSSSGPNRFPISALVYCAPKETIDCAVLRLAPFTGAMPKAVPIDWSSSSLGRNIGGAFRGDEVYVVGHPVSETPSPAVEHVFGGADGRKRCAPGEVTSIDPGGQAFEHDCSTLPGNSGSCVLTVGGHEAVGLHCTGRGVDLASGVARANSALALSSLSGSALAKLFC